MTEGTVAEILGLTDKQIQQFSDAYDQGIDHIKYGASKVDVVCRLWAEKIPIHLNLVFMRDEENGNPTLIRFKKLSEEEYKSSLK